MVIENQKLQEHYLLVTISFTPATTSLQLPVASYPYSWRWWCCWNCSGGTGPNVAPGQVEANSIFSTITSAGGGGGAGDNTGSEPTSAALDGGSGGGGARSPAGGSGNTPPVKSSSRK